MFGWCVDAVSEREVGRGLGWGGVCLGDRLETRCCFSRGRIDGSAGKKSSLITVFFERQGFVDLNW